MIIRLIAVGQKMPGWVQEGFGEYQKRLSRDYQLQLVEIPAIKRLKNANADIILAQEAQKIREKLLPGEHIIALDRLGKPISTLQMADTLMKHHDLSQNIALIIGGAEGICPDLIRTAHQTWSLSALTFPHPLVRIIISEQIYRAYSIISNHPYHR